MASLHVIFASFFMPMAFVFAVTGGLYTFDVKGTYDTETRTLPLSLPTEPKSAELMEVARAILREQFATGEPSGRAGLRQVGTSWQFEWTGSRTDFTIEPTKETGLFKVSLKRMRFHRLLVQLHKAKGGTPFKVLAGAFAVGLLLLFLSGILLAAAQPRLRRLFAVGLLAGGAIFTAAIVLS